MTRWKRQTFKVILAIVTVTTCTPEVSADFLLGGVSSAPGASISINRYTDDGQLMGVVGTVPDESCDLLAVDGFGNIYANGNTLGGGSLYEFSPGVERKGGFIPQWGDPAGLTFAWNGRLFGTSTQPFGSSTVVGILEFDPSTLSYKRTAIQSSDSIYYNMTFDANYSPKNPNYSKGALYVTEGQLSGGVVQYSIKRFLLNPLGNLTADTTFSIASQGPMQLDPSGSILYSVDPGSPRAISRYDTKSGASLGVLATIPTDSSSIDSYVGDLALAPDGSIFADTHYYVYHFNANGSFIGSPLNFGYIYSGPILYLVPEPMTFFILIPAFFLLVHRSNQMRV